MSTYKNREVVVLGYLNPSEQERVTVQYQDGSTEAVSLGQVYFTPEERAKELEVLSRTMDDKEKNIVKQEQTNKELEDRKIAEDKAKVDFDTKLASIKNPEERSKFLADKVIADKKITDEAFRAKNVEVIKDRNVSFNNTNASNVDVNKTEALAKAERERVEKVRNDVARTTQPSVTPNVAVQPVLTPKQIEDNKKAAEAKRVADAKTAEDKRLADLKANRVQ